MATLHIEHAITDFDLWRCAFDRMAVARAGAGVQRVAIRRPVDDPKYVLVELEFATATAAEQFRTFLEREVWSSGTNAPALAGAPRAVVLEDA